AYLDAVPTLFVGGAAPLADAETLPLQSGFDQVELVRPVTKWAHRVTHTHRIPDLVAQALRVATTGRPGPVFLEIPIDVLFARVEEERAVFPRIIRPETAPAPAPAAVERAIEWLAAAERPVILAGGGAWFSQSSDELRRFAERIRAPVFPNGKSRGMLSDDHPLCGRNFASLAALSRVGAGSPDVVLVFGARLGLFTGGRSGSILPTGAKVIQVDVEGEEIGRNRDVDLGIVADCRETLRALDAAAAPHPWPERAEWQRAVERVKSLHRELFEEALARTGAPIHPYHLARALAEAVEPGAILVADGGETASWLDMVADVRGGGHWLSHGYLGCLGTGMPFAIAAKVAHPDRQVVCIIGDGSVGLNFAEFDTMVRHDLAIVTVVNNDRQWGMSLHGQELLYGKDRTVVTALGPTRYDVAAAGFGCHSELVEDPKELAGALRRALESGRPACVNVMTDPSVIAPATLAMYGAFKGSAKAARGAKEGAEKVQMPYYGEGDT
ncbi:MAG: thiamine pyrophosphate-binding protein, partial [Candidatus Binatia bacterium]